jgi:hypothetical protein
MSNIVVNGETACTNACKELQDTSAFAKSPKEQALLQLEALFLPHERFSIENQRGYTDSDGNLRTCVQDFLIASISDVKLMVTLPELFCINALQPLAASRQGSELAAYRNFLLECDSSATPIEEQLRRLEPFFSDFRTVTLSGGKSVHCIVSCADTLPFRLGDDPNHTAYKEVWQGLNRYYSNLTGLTFDDSTKNPNRVSRLAGATRAKTLQVQKLVHVGGLQTSDVLIALRVPSLQRAVRTELCASSVRMFLDILSTTQQGRHFRDIMEYKVFMWAASEGMRKKLFQYACWAIDLTNCQPDVLMSYLQEHTFPVLQSRGYPTQKFDEPIFSAFKHKGVL